MSTAFVSCCPRIALAALSSTFLFGGGIVATAQDAQELARQMSDEEISSAVETEFWTDEVVDANNIDTSTADGVVTLTGEVPDILSKERAAAIASYIVGVRAVVNRLQVEPTTERTDEKLRQAVEKALLDDPAADSYEVRATVSDGGVVTLRGHVDSWAERLISEQTAKSVRGVTAVKNELDVRIATERPDLEIQREIEARLENDVLVDDYAIDVEVEDGVVTLAGAVGSLAEKNRARHDAFVNGVEEVRDGQLQLEWWARDSQRRKKMYVTRPDEVVREAVEAAFLHDPRVLSFSPQVAVDDGTVTLRGVVDNATAKRAAEADARNVVGVWRVRNLLKVRPETIPDDRTLEERVERALLEDPQLEHWAIDVDAVSGWVYLSGTLDNSFKENHAESVAANVKGVVAVIDNLDFEHTWKWRPDAEIKANVRDELWWNAFVDAGEINVDVEDGVVTLSGEVDTWSERRAAERQAYEGGAKDVVNDLRALYRYYGPHYGYYPGRSSSLAPQSWRYSGM